MKIQRTYVDMKNRNTPDVFDSAAITALIKRIAGDVYAQTFVFEQAESDGFDCFEVFAKDNKICIRANAGVSAAAGFNQYLKEVCHYSVGILSTSGSLPAEPPVPDIPIRRKSKFLYRYFFNYCTFSYTYAFDNWSDWEKTLDYLLLSGYNLILNPVGIEWVWKKVLCDLHYTDEDVEAFLCGPAFYAWQWMMNMTGWTGGAPEHWYEQRVKLAGKINERLQSFGASSVIPGYAGMVPDSFTKYFPDSKIVEQGYWVGFKRPGLILPTDPNYDRIADLYYNTCRKIKGADKIAYFSADPFHEGGITEGVDLGAFARGTYKKMSEYAPNAIWVMQEWGKPKTEIIENLNDGSVLVLSLCADSKPTAADQTDIAPWCYCAVNVFGGQYTMHGAAKEQLLNPFRHLANHTSKIVGIGYMPESVNCNEILYAINAENAFGNGFGSVEDFLKVYSKDRYGKSQSDILETLRKVFLVSFHMDRPLGGESALCARPALDVCRASAWSTPAKPYLDQTILVDYVQAMFAHYDELSEHGGYRMDLLEAARQMLSNLSWYYVDRIRESYFARDLKTLSAFGQKLLRLFELQSDLVSCDRGRMLGTWLKKARRWGKTAEERAYFEKNARLQITLWGDRNAAKYLRDYSAREWQGMLEDFYKPRWERFLARLENALMMQQPLEDIDDYAEEIGFVHAAKRYPVKENHDLKHAVEAVIREVTGERIAYRTYGEKQSSFLENVTEDMTKQD